jgi:large subunit ribosomal protein L18
MKLGKAYTLQWRRKREGKTDYKSRLKMLSSRKLRLVLRKSLNNFNVQVVEYAPAGDKTLAAANSRELIKYGWKAHRGNISSVYLTAFLAGMKAKKTGVKTGVVDLGLFRIVKGSNFFAAIKGIKDSGLEINVNEEFLPSEDRIQGKHVEEYAKLLKGKKDYDLRFSQYLKHGVKPEELSKHFADVKKKIAEKWK